jgi:pyridoxamine 5'-phosphate oxidase
MPTPDPAGLRRSYEGGALSESAVPAEPLTFFSIWFTAAVSAGLPEPNAMILATAGPDGEPSARTVLLKGYGLDGFRFFTNHGSRKGRDLQRNPRASLLFPWYPVHRQVRVTGRVARLSEPDAEAYFRTRPYGSQIGAWASRQSTEIGSRAELVDRFAELAARWPEGTEIPLPPFWGGYLVIPDEVEFWQGRPDRLHDRLVYRRKTEGSQETGHWSIVRLSP